MWYKISHNVDMCYFYQVKNPCILNSVAVKPIKFQDCKETEQERKDIKVGKKIQWAFTLETIGAADQVKTQKL